MRYNFKKIISLLIVLSLTFSVTTNLGAKELKAKLSSSKLVLQIGATSKITVSKSEKNSSLSWSSSNTNIATVNNGVVKGLKKGNAVITCEVKSGNSKYSLKCNVAVINKLTNLVNVSPTLVTKYEGNQGDSFWDVLGKRNGKTDTTGKTYSNGVEIWLARWNFQNEKSFVNSQFNVDSQYSNLRGRIVALKSSYNTNNYDSTFKVIGDGNVLYTYKLTPKTIGKDINVNIEGVNVLTIIISDNLAVSGGTSFGFVNSTLEGSSMAFPKMESTKYSLDIGSNENISLKYKADNTTYRWYSENESVAAVDNNGKVTAVSSGTTQVKCEVTNPYGNKTFLSCDVIVNKGGTYLETLTPSSSERYTGNAGDSFMQPLGTRNGFVDVHDKKYTHGLEAWVARWNFRDEKSWVYNEYIIDKKYTALTGEISVIKDSYNNNNFNTTIEIIGDGVVLKSYTVTPDLIPIAVNVDLTNISTVRISVKDNIAVSGGTSFALGDFKFVK